MDALVGDFEKDLKSWEESLRRAPEPLQESCIITVVGESGDPVHFVVLEHGETHMDSVSVLSLTLTGMHDILPSLAIDSFQLHTLSGLLIPPHTQLACATTVRLVPIKGRRAKPVTVTYKNVPLELVCDPSDVLEKACDAFMVAVEDHCVVPTQTGHLLVKKTRTPRAKVYVASETSKIVSIVVRHGDDERTLGASSSWTLDTLLEFACRRFHTPYECHLVPRNDQAVSAVASNAVVDQAAFDLVSSATRRDAPIVIKVAASVVVPPQRLSPSRTVEVLCGPQGVVYRDLLEDVCTTLRLEAAEYELVHRSKKFKHVVYPGTHMELRTVSPNNNPF